MILSDSEKGRLKQKYGPWAMITGASSGIGLELADQLASAGLHLVIHARNQDRLEQIANELRTKHTVNIDIVASDLSLPDGCERLIQSASNRQIGLLIANAGYGTSGEFIHSDLKEELKMLHVNCQSVLLLTHYFSRRFAELKKGGIILLSSIVAFQGVTYAAHYAATKAYVQSLAEALHQELKPYQVDVLAAVPAPVESAFGQRANMKLKGAMKPSQVGVPILKALGRSATVLPGFLSIFLINALRTVPRWAKIKIMKLVMGGMTKHQRTYTPQNKSLTTF